MDALTKAIEGELEKAFPVQDREALHRCSRLISEELVQHHHYNNDIAKIHADIKHIIEKMDDRFAAMDKRFDSIDRRFTHMVRFMTLGFTILAMLLTVFNFL